MNPGDRVRCRRTGRLGVIARVIDPPRAGRCLYVVWGGSLDFSLMSADELEPHAGAARATDRRADALPDPDWRVMLPGDGPDVLLDHG